MTHYCLCVITITSVYYYRYLFIIVIIIIDVPGPRARLAGCEKTSGAPISTWIGLHNAINVYMDWVAWIGLHGLYTLHGLDCTMLKHVGYTMQLTYTYINIRPHTYSTCFEKSMI